MADINSWTVTGRLGKDAEYRVLAGGKALLSFSMAVNTGWGEYKKTLWVNVRQWGERGAKLMPYLTKGKLIGATGSLSLNVWQGKDGVEHTDLALDTSSIQLLGGEGGDKPTPAPKEADSSSKEDGDIDEVPF